ncbi:acyl-ACP desaturase [Streptomyces sp. GESEQ-35]|uniref:acyl-ACP desaturase n=1 Tax=Streptomyces sp. GESEQ-35 TaxID=2812657 RepID=UPI001B331AF2|nr:acyl-ACP desaturase [Streptomyces sp. GESEQ-35]
MTLSPRAGGLSASDWLAELEPVVGTLLERHLARSQEWFPHQYVPWGQGRDFDGPLEGDPWEAGQSSLSSTARSALVLNLLTEDNLPGYHWALSTRISRSGAWAEWINRWTAEEDRHSTALRAYLHATRAVDPVALERARLAHVATGYEPGRDGLLQNLVYVTVQELATRVSHRNAGRHSGEENCERLLTRIAQDENLHMVFYRDLLAAALAIDADAVVQALCDCVATFQMPGHRMPGFRRMAWDVALAGVYDLRVHHDDVLAPLLRSLSLWTLQGLGPAGEQAREGLARELERTNARARAFEGVREQLSAKEHAIHLQPPR